MFKVILSLMLCTSVVAQDTPPWKCMPDNSTCWPSKSQWSDFEDSLQGKVYWPWVIGNNLNGWSNAIKLKNQRLDIIPAVAVMAETIDDVQKSIAFVAENQLLFSVKSTGHCYSGNCMAQDGFHLDVSKMDNVGIDTDTQLMTVGPGTNFAAMYSAADAANLQVVGGMCATVGPIGFSTGGGHGPLIRSYGLGADNIVSIKMVLANSELIELNETSIVNNELWQDLWWAVRGGGGGTFGVVVEMKVQAHVAPSKVVSLTCDWPLAHNEAHPGQEVLDEWWSGIMSALPNEWMFFTIALPAPIPLTIEPDNWDGSTMQGILSLEGVYNGDLWSNPDAINSVMPIVNLLPDEQLQCSFENHTGILEWHDTRWFGSTPVDMRDYMSTSFAQPGFDASGLSTLVTNKTLALSSTTMDSFFGIQTGGAVSTASSNAVGSNFRSSYLLMETDSNWLTAMSDNSNVEWTQQTGQDIAAISGMAGAYVNEPDPELADYETEFWGSNFDKLQEVKRSVDPDEFFICHQCVYN
mmetsp:Transcript_41275/g.53254  ORF Transcript_41275/g.53254 Transcript_41275/m.53254 type:complete len:523 (+) Transcript_41275:55-1623(+)